MGQSERDENVNGEAISGTNEEGEGKVWKVRGKEGTRIVISSACGNSSSRFLD